MAGREAARAAAVVFVDRGERQASIIARVRFGFHVSIAGGFANVGERALALGCETIQVFSSNPRGWSLAALDPADVGKFRQDVKATGICPVFCHVPYLPNLAASGSGRRRSVQALVAQMERCEVLGVDYLVCHVGRGRAAPGEVRRQRREARAQSGGAEPGEVLRRVAENVNAVLAKAKSRAMLLLENTAGMGSEVGHRFGQIAAIIEQVEERTRVGVMLDTAHAFEAGYEWRTKAGIDATLREFDRSIGLARLHGLHLNDSKTAFGSRVDRHWHIGKGEIGTEGMRLIVNHPLLHGLAAVMETPRTTEKEDRANMRAVRRLAADSRRRQKREVRVQKAESGQAE